MINVCSGSLYYKHVQPLLLFKCVYPCFLLQDLLVFLRDKTGIPNLDFNDIWDVEDTLFIEVRLACVPLHPNLMCACVCVYMWCACVCACVCVCVHVCVCVCAYTVYFQSIYNVTPTWYTPDLFNRIKNISDYTLSLMFNSQEKSRLSAGMFCFVHFP